MRGMIGQYSETDRSSGPGTPRSPGAQSLRLATLPTLFRLAEALGVKPGRILDRIGEEMDGG